MVAQIPLNYVLADTLYAAGIGFLLSFAYTLLRMWQIKLRIWVFLCDLSVLTAAGILYTSVATTRFYSGILRWYTVLALILGYGAWQFVAYTKFIFFAKAIKFLTFWPISKIWSIAFKPMFVCISAKIVVMYQKTKKWRKKNSNSKTKQLQKPLQVLYNSK